MGTDLLTSDSAAIRAGVSSSTIQRYVDFGKLPVAKRGPRRVLWFDPVAVDQWAAWFRTHRAAVRQRRRQGSALSRVNGMIQPGQLPYVQQEEVDRERLFTLAKSADKKEASRALRQLYVRYNKLRLPMEERRVGINVEKDIE